VVRGRQAWALPLPPLLQALRWAEALLPAQSLWAPPHAPSVLPAAAAAAAALLLREGLGCPARLTCLVLLRKVLQPLLPFG